MKILLMKPQRKGDELLSLLREISDVECGEQKFEFELKYNLV